MENPLGLEERTSGLNFVIAASERSREISAS